MQDALNSNPIAEKSSRATFIDTARVLSLLWIFVWHADDYSGDLLQNAQSTLLTKAALGLFFMLSALQLAPQFRIVGNDIVATLKCFLSRRLTRIYLPYFLALSLFFAIGVITPRVFAENALLYSLHSNNTVMTLWFVTVLLAYYLMLPIITRKTVWGWVLATVAISSLLYLLSTASLLREQRLAPYFLLFSLGASPFAGKLITSLRKQWFIPVTSLAVCFVLPDSIVTPTVSYGMDFQTAAMAIIAMPLLIKSADWISLAIRPRQFIEWLAIRGYYTYLIHRPIYLLVVPLSPQGPISRFLCIALVGIPLSIALADAIHRGTTFIQKHIRNTP